MCYACIKSVHCNEYLVNQDSSSNSVEYTPMRFQLFMG